MDVTVYPDVTLLIVSKCLEQLLGEVNFRVEFKVRVDPLPVQINSCNRVSIIATDNSIWVKYWDQHKSIELA